MACSWINQNQSCLEHRFHVSQTYQDAKLRLVSNIEHIRQWQHFLSEPIQPLFLGNKSYSSYHAVHSWKQVILKGLEILDIALRLGMNALRHVKDTGKHFVCMYNQSVMSLDKNTGFLRFRLPVLLQQNLRCKVWDDTAKIRYIALFAISEQCSQIILFFF